MAETFFDSDLSCARLNASGATVGGTLSATNVSASTTTATNLAVGTGPAGTRMTHLISSLASVNFGAIPANDSISTNITVAGAVAGAAAIVNPTSLWSGAYNDIALVAVVSAASTIALKGINSTATSVTPDAQNMRFTVINF